MFQYEFEELHHRFGMRAIATECTALKYSMFCVYVMLTDIFNNIRFKAESSSS